MIKVTSPFPALHPRAQLPPHSGVAVVAVQGGACCGQGRSVYVVRLAQCTRTPTAPRTHAAPRRTRAGTRARSRARALAWGSMGRRPMGFKAPVVRRPMEPHATEATIAIHARVTRGRVGAEATRARDAGRQAPPFVSPPLSVSNSLVAGSGTVSQGPAIAIMLQTPLML